MPVNGKLLAGIILDATRASARGDGDLGQIQLQPKEIPAGTRVMLGAKFQAGNGILYNKGEKGKKVLHTRDTVTLQLDNGGIIVIPLEAKSVNIPLYPA